MGTNSGAVDSWLGSLGYYRKNIANDKTCLFRAVAEQMFDYQLYHERVQQDCILYGKKHSKEFKHLVPIKRDWFNRLKSLSINMLVCTDIEIQLVCKTYEVDITIFTAADRSIQEFKCHPLYVGDQKLLICKMSEDHYDAVYCKKCQLIQQENGNQQLISDIENFDASKLKHVETCEKNLLPTKEVIDQEKSTLGIQNQDSFLH